MRRLLVLVEGQTEETFVHEVLGPYLFANGYGSVAARLVGHARQRSRRGGIRGWAATKADILRHLHQDRGVLVSTMVDFYALPQDGKDGWPGRQAAGKAPPADKARLVEAAILQDLHDEGAAVRRLVPFVVLHEFEALLFSDCAKFAVAIGRPDLAGPLQKICADAHGPERINDSPITAPSKRIIDLMPHYQKPLHGNLAALDVGMPTMRAACPHFSSWIERLETWQNP